MRSLKRCWLASIVAGLLTVACGSVPQTHYYVLASAEQAVAAEVDTDRVVERSPVVGIRTFSVDPPYDQGLLVYRVGADALEVGFYDYHRWASPLGSLAALAFASEASSAVGSIVFEPATHEGRYAAILRGRIRTLEEVDEPGGQVVRVTLELSLDDTRGEAIWQRTVSSESKVQAQDAGQIVARLQADFSELVRAAAGEVAAALSDTKTQD